MPSIGKLLVIMCWSLATLPLGAARHRLVCHMPSNWMMRPGSRMLEALERLVAQLRDGVLVE